jgi:negative regulator of flagellin synthesis FlgM
MIISSKQLQSILQLNQVSETRKKIDLQDQTAVNKTDSLVLSSRAQELQFAKEQVLKSPEVRAERINEIKKQIQEGNYRVSSSEIALKMISRSLADELAGR